MKGTDLIESSEKPAKLISPIYSFPVCQLGLALLMSKPEEEKKKKKKKGQ